MFIECILFKKMFTIEKVYKTLIYNNIKLIYKG